MVRRALSGEVHARAVDSHSKAPRGIICKVRAGEVGDRVIGHAHHERRVGYRFDPVVQPMLQGKRQSGRGSGWLRLAQAVSHCQWQARRPAPRPQLFQPPTAILFAALTMGGMQDVYEVSVSF